MPLHCHLVNTKPHWGFIWAQHTVIYVSQGDLCAYTLLQVTMLLIMNNAMQGILSSFFFKYADTILKKYSSTMATIFTGLMSALLFGHALTLNFLIGVTIVFISMHIFFSQGQLFAILSDSNCMVWPNALQLMSDHAPALCFISDCIFFCDRSECKSDNSMAWLPYVLCSCPTMPFKWMLITQLHILAPVKLEPDCIQQCLKQWEQCKVFAMHMAQPSCSQICSLCSQHAFSLYVPGWHLQPACFC